MIYVLMIVGKKHNSEFMHPLSNKPYLIVNQLGPVGSNELNSMKDVDLLVHFHLIEHYVRGDVHTASAHAVTEIFILP